MTNCGSSVVYLELIATFIYELSGSLDPCLWMGIAALIVAPLTLFETPKDFW